jgi:hypothetical protein
MQIVMEDNRVSSRQQETGELVKKLTVIGLVLSLCLSAMQTILTAVDFFTVHIHHSHVQHATGNSAGQLV